MMPRVVSNRLREHCDELLKIPTVALFFGYTHITNQPENVGISRAIGFAVNIYYGTLHA